MKSLLYQLNINNKRLILRNFKAFIFALIFPIFFYVLYSKIFVMPMPAGALKIWQVDYMISMLIYGVLMTGITNISSSLLQDHLNHFDLFVELSPTSKWKYHLSMIMSYLGFYVVLIVLLGVTAFFLNGVSLKFVQWLGIFILLLVAVIPFSLLGVLISFTENTNAVNILGNLITFPLAILGGLWWPLEIMPQWIVKIGKLLPTNQALVLIREWTHSQTIHLNSLLGLVLWTLLITGFIVIMQVMIKHKEPQLI